VTAEMSKTVAAAPTPQTATDPSTGPLPLPQPGSRRSRAITFFVGVIIFAIPPPRAIAAVAGDLVQIVVLLTAITIPLIVLRASNDWGHINKLGSKIFENVSKRRDEIVEILIANMVRFGWSMLLLILSKVLFTWFAGKQWHVLLICRSSDGLAGGILFLSINKARFLVTAIRHAVWDTWTKSIMDGIPSNPSIKVGVPETRLDEVIR